MKWSRTTIGLVILACCALVLRVVVVAALWSDHAAPVAYEHGRIAENLLAGDGFSIEYLGVEGPTSQQAPFYPFFLAVAYWCLGVATPAAHLAVQLIQCLVGTALVLIVTWLGWSLVPQHRGVGWTAGIGAAVYPTHLYAVTHLQVVLWAALLLTALVAVVVSRSWQRTWPGAIVAGLLCGLILLVEPILALTLPACAVTFWLAETNRFRLPAILRVGTMAGVAVLLIAPWIVRNSLVHGEFVFVKSSFGYAFWQGNNAQSWGTDKIPKPSAEQLRTSHNGSLAGMNKALWEARHETLYIDDVLLKPDGYQQFQGLTEPERSRLLGEKAKQFIRANPDRYAELCLQRLRYFLLFDETNPKAANRLYRACTAVWFLFSTIGLLVSLGQFRRFYPTYAIFAVVTAFHALVITSVRFRMPLEPITFVWAALVVAPLLGRLMPRWKSNNDADHDEPVEHGRKHALRGPHFHKTARRRVA